MKKTDLEGRKEELLYGTNSVQCRVFHGRWPMDFCLKRIEAARENPGSIEYAPCPTCMQIRRMLKLKAGRKR